LIGTLPWGAAPEAVQAQGPSVVRALWVDAFHDGIKTPAQVERLLADARRANVNTLIVQVRRRGDAYYLDGPEPMAADAQRGFDALKAVIEAAHSSPNRIEVQAWIPVYPIWSSRDRLPSDPSHPLHRHGSAAPGEENWLLTRDDGETWAGDSYWFDPGHPAVQAYLVDLATDLARRYDLDGLHLDRFRYPEGENVSAGVRDRRWGYNPVSVARFNAEHGRSGQSEPNDAAWAGFRRERVTELLRQIRESALAQKPGLKLSAAVIPWGRGPSTDAEWTSTAAYAYVFQDWRHWLEAGLLDQAIAMNYFRQSNPAQVAMLDTWLAWQRTRSYGRQVISGLAPYLNEPGESVRQIRRSLAPGPDGSRLAGVALYSYAVPDASRNNANPADNTPEGFLWDVLSRPLAENEFNPPFAGPASVPPIAGRN
jgi:uncharacterized lipoprotein YddW (UPF0748 family)